MLRYGPMKATLKIARNIARPLCASVLLLLGLLLGGCRQMFQSFYLSGYDRDISSSAREIETARDNTASQRLIPSEAARIRKKPAIAGLPS